MVPDTQNQMAEFMNRIMHLAQSTGWHGGNIETYYGPDIMLSCVCPHGQSVTTLISAWAVGHAPDCGGGAAMADAEFAKLVTFCNEQHANIPPPGSFIYPLGSSGPIGYKDYQTGGYVPIEDFKEKYATEYQKQLGKQLVAYGSYTYQVVQGFTTGVVNGISYGGSGSILDELLSICPGLATVARECPDRCVEYGSEALPLSHLIQHINDRHEWSREKIAEWLDIIALEDPNTDLTIKPKEKQHAQPSIGPSSEAVAELYGDLTFDAGNVNYGEFIKGILGGGS